MKKNSMNGIANIAATTYRKKIIINLKMYLIDICLMLLRIMLIRIHRSLFHTVLI